LKNDDTIKINDELIARYLAGEATPEEAIALDDWLNDPVNQSYFEDIKRVWSAVHPQKKSRNVIQGEAWTQINKETNGLRLTERSSQSVFTSRYILRVAASVTLLIIASLIIYYAWQKNVPDIRLTTAQSLLPVNFPDQSTATLNRDTEIIYPETFEGTRREVRLVKGEAFFTIKPDKESPFIIHTGIADIKVLGTSFNVAVKDGKVEVGVYEGRVMVTSVTDTLYLTAGSAGQIGTERGTINTGISANANDWGYATRHFVFKDTPLKQVIANLEKAYPYTIRIKNGNINNCKLTATFDKVSAEKMLALIAETLNLSVTRNDTVFILEGEGCP
jgi:ferric-dicitrate binding protein FerR (iron transport regulator)